MFTSNIAFAVYGFIVGMIVMGVYWKVVMPDVKALVAKFEAAKAAFEQAAADIKKV